LFDIDWSPKELDKIAEIKSRPNRPIPDRIKRTDALARMLREVEGMSDDEVEQYLKRHKL
jgi:hypothetical protein